MDDVYIYYKYDYCGVNTRLYDAMMMYLLDVYNKDDNDLLYSSLWSFLSKKKHINNEYCYNYEKYVCVIVWRFEKKKKEI